MFVEVCMAFQWTPGVRGLKGYIQFQLIYTFQLIWAVLDKAKKKFKNLCRGYFIATDVSGKNIFTKIKAKTKVMALKNKVIV